MENNITIQKSSVFQVNQAIRNKILDLEDKMKQVPSAYIGDSELCPLKHSFADGVYVREIFIPKGTLIVGKIHKHSHPNFLMKGKVSVLTEEGVKHLEAPLSMVSPSGTKRVVYAHEDTVWITTHVTKKKNLEKIEKEIIAKNYGEIDAIETKMEESKFLNFIKEAEDAQMVSANLAG